LAEKGRRHCRAQRLRPAALLEASGMAALCSTQLTVNWHGGSIGKLKSFSLLFGPRFPVMPKSFPVNFHKEIR
jgi:hypothetical protein